MATFVHQLISQSAIKSPNADALTVKDKQLSYQALNDFIFRIASGFHHLAVGQHDRIGVYLHKSFENVGCMFASSINDAVFVPINPALKTPQVQHIVNDCQIKLLITNKARLQAMLAVLPKLTSITHIILTDADEQFTQQINHDITQGLTILSWQFFIETPLHSFSNKITTNDMAAILYTSGSTGKPKGVVLSHNNIILGAKSVATYLNNTAEDKILAVLPLSFDYGLSQLTTSFLVGANCILLDYLLPNDVLKAVNKYKITGLAAVPPLWSQLCKLNWPDNTGQSIRYFTNSGGALSQANLTQLRQLMPNALPYLMYGLTEAFRSTYLAPEFIDQRIGSMGKAIPNAEILVIKPDGTECLPNEVGELVHKGPLVSLGYWNSPEKTAERFKLIPHNQPSNSASEIAVFSGDKVKKDEDGFLYFVARADEMIKTSGYRVSPMEVEEILYQHSTIKEAAIIGVPHEQLGQAIIAIVCLTQSDDVATSEKLILTHCQKQLANYLVPKKVIVLAHLPHNANGKIDRNRLNLTYQHYFS